MCDKKVLLKILSIISQIVEKVGLPQAKKKNENKINELIFYQITEYRMENIEFSMRLLVFSELQLYRTSYADELKFYFFV